MTKVLLVEDDNNLREIYEARLQAEGYNIVSANDGEEALVLAKNEQPDLIISDVMMPKISGFEMLDILRNTAGLEKVKVIMLTALGQADDQTRANKLGADRYLVKSQVTLEDIVKTAHELMADTSPPATPAATANPTSSDATAPQATDDSSATSAVQPAPSTPTATDDSSIAPIAVAKAPDEGSAASTTTPTSAATDSGAASPAPNANQPASATVTDSSTQSTAQEEAQVKEQIENFIDNQPGTKAEASSPTAPPTSSASPETTKAERSANATADDKVLSEAMDTLIADTEKPAKESTTPTPPEPTIVTPAPAAASTSTEPTASSEGGRVSIAHKKVIEPLDSEPKTPLDALVAMEEAQETANTPPQPVVSSTEEPSPEIKPLQSATPLTEEPTHTPGNIITPDPNAGSTENLPGFDPNHVAL
ncbi:MAG TPA: response regulator [Candidatus Saccharimonadales bacterium]|nr:response regulator [Candidatus Saccharimonadales bacterium]